MGTAFLISAMLFFPTNVFAADDHAFESALIRPTGHFAEGCNLPEITGGPGTSAPTTLTIPAMRPIDLLSTAFDLRSSSIRGLDRFGFAWNGETVYTIVAKVPRGATKDEIVPMLQRMLVDRFHLVAHRETQNAAAYELTVAPSGIRMTKSPQTTLHPVHHSCQGRLDKNGYPSPCPGCAGMAMVGQNGIMRIGARYTDFPDVVGQLSDLLGRPVLDKTGLVGRFDFTLSYSWDGMAGPGVDHLTIATEAGATRLIAAVLEHLGLVLKPVRVPVEVLKIDHLDAKPTKE